MYIRRLTLENVKSFREKEHFTFGPMVNFFVGDNNSGKSTILEAVLWLFNGPTRYFGQPEEFYSNGAIGPTSVTAEIVGLDKISKDGRYAKLRPMVFRKDGAEILRIRRSSQEYQIEQKGKPVKIDVKKITCWNPESEQFENLTGIPALLQSLFEFEAVWADAHPSEHVDFSANKTLGRVFASALVKVAQTARWKAFERAHHSVFSEAGDGTFYSESVQIADRLTEIISEQYGSAALKFDFQIPDPSAYMKQGVLHVDDGAGETPFSGKGMGMQRAIMLALIQLLAEYGTEQGDGVDVPLVLMLDEPETWLHPRAQLHLAEALAKLGKRNQVFILTHSPYLIREFDADGHRLTIVSGVGENRRIEQAENLGVIRDGVPSWGEINYRAFGVASPEFHDELFSYVQERVSPAKAKAKFATMGDVDKFLIDCGLSQEKEWEYVKGEGRGSLMRATLPVYVRNSIHHPENRKNPVYTSDELLLSTQYLMKVVDSLIVKGVEPSGHSVAQE